MDNNFQLLKDLRRRNNILAKEHLEYGHYGYMWVSANSKSIIASHTVYDMLEMEPFSEFLTIESWRQMVHTQDLFKLLQAEETLLAFGQPVTVEYRMITKKNRIIFVSHFMQVSAADENGRKILSMLDEITEHKRADVILEAMNEGFFELDKHFAFRRINAKAEFFFGIERDSVMHLPFLEVFPQAEDSPFYQLLRTAAKDRRSHVQDVLWPVNNNWLHVSASPYTDGIIVIFYNIQNEKESEEKIKQSESKYHSLVEHMPDAISRWDKDLKLIFANSAFETKMGISHKNLHGKTQSEMGQPDEIALPWTQSLEKVFCTGSPVEHFHCFQTAKGEIHFYSRIVPEKNDNGEVETVLSIARDITELKRAEQQLINVKDELARTATGKYLTLFNSIDQGFCIIEVIFDDAGNAIDYRFLEVNPVFENQTGFRNATGKTIREFVPEMEEHWFRIYGEVAKTGKAKRFEQHAAHLKTGTTYEVYAFRFGKPEDHQVAILFNDITERKDAEQRLRDFNAVLEQEVSERVKELKESKDLLQSIFDAGLIGMSVLKAYRDDSGAIKDFRIQLVNAHVEKATGRTDLVGKLYVEEYPGVRETGLFDFIANVTETGISGQLDYYYHHEGFDKWLSSMFIKLDDGVVATTLDITDRKQAEEKIIELNKILHSKNRELRAANSELTTFNTIVANNYKETLKQLYTNLEFIVSSEAHNLTNGGKASIRRTQTGIQKMKLLTDDIIALSKIQSPDNVLSEVNLNEVFKTVLTDLEEKIAETEALIDADTLPEIEGYPLLLSLLFYHLTDNAIKFRQKNNVLFIRIRYKKIHGLALDGALPEMEYHSISFIDNGIGFPQNESMNLFQVFYRLHDKGTYKGSGIGLSICKKIMDVHIGFIIAESNPGNGARFTCFFPVEK